MGYNIFKDLCTDFQTEMKDIHSYSGYRVEGQQCALKFATMNRLRLFIRWMSTRMKYTTFEFSAEHLLAITFDKFNVFRQADMIRMGSKPTSSPPCQTTPMTTSQSSGSKKRQAFLSQHEDLLHEPDSESAEETLLDQDQYDSSSSSPFLSSFNSPEPQQLTRYFIHNWGDFYVEAKNLTVEDNKKVQVVHPTQHSTIGNPEPKPSSVLGQPNPKPQPGHFHDNYPSPDNPPQDVDNSCHLSDSTSTNDSLDESSTLSVPDDHLLQVDSTISSFQLQETSSVEIEFVPEVEGYLNHANLSQTYVFHEHHDYEVFLLNQEIHAPSDNLSHQESHNCEKLCQDDPFSLMPQTLV